ncbi:hypothetical protein [Bradyrhizobium ottawaense]|uniref:Novel STAND NTPase 3 domain-containing protein n=2 Tax=Bradyrhizobium TaxID=374 RepID=A0ABY0PM60_9BRAD|nr:hypothetical protein [Bradyrhizobium ottawaense]SDI63674.1 hypothetical protein SAMN05444163_3326 [Bradyrhizobium ottawaense]
MSELTPSSQDQNAFSPSSGGASLEGYFYQLDVSILTALDLVLAKKVAHEIVLEPATDEDLEADIDNEPGALSETITLDNYRLVLQCKLRSTGPWKYEDLIRLLAHGKKRKPARERLTDPKIRYLLVTSADLDGVARQLRVELIGEWPLPSDLPIEIGKTLPADAGGRLAVLSAMDQEKVNSRTERLLTQRFRVPHANLQSCRGVLRKEALLRMRGAAHGVWARDDIERNITISGGYVGESDALEGFVPPTNWDELKTAIETRHAVVVTGASGTGKTRAAKALVADLRDKIPGIRHVFLQGGPEKVHGDKDFRPVVYEIEDPWGRFRLEPASIPWNDAISEILRSAAPDRKFVITSRSDVLHESNPRSLKGKWLITLEEENYGPKERTALFENRLPGLSPRLQPIVLRYRQEAVERLTTPLEMHRYFSVLADGFESNENEAEYVRRCLSDAHQTSIETALINNVRQRGAWAWAAIVWGLFKARSRLTFNILPSIQAGLTKRQSDLEDGLEPYVNFLIAGRNLRQSEATLSYQHPRVELGLEEALKEKPGLSSRVLAYLIDVLIDLDRRTGTDWGTEGAANLVQAVRERSVVQLDLSTETQSHLDRWIDDRISGAGQDFKDDLTLAASVGSPNCIPAEIARWLLSRPKDKERWFFENWVVPARIPEWFQRIRADSRTKDICIAFITRELPHGHRFYPNDFATSIAGLSDGLEPAFADAAFSIVKDGYNPNADLIAAGAIVDLNRFEMIVSAAISYQRELSANPDDGFLLAVANGEYDDAAAEHYYESASEDGQTAGELLEWYVSERRANDGWQAIRDHAHAKGLLWTWIRVAEKAKNATTDEWLAIASAVEGESEERTLWETLRGSLPIELLPKLRNRIVPGDPNREIRVQALMTAIRDAPSEIIPAIRLLESAKDVRRMFELALDLAAANAADAKENQSAYGQMRVQILEALPAALAEAMNAVFSSQFEGLSRDALTFFQNVDAEGNTELKLVQAEILSRAAFDVSNLLEDILGSPDNSDVHIQVATNAVSIAARCGLWSVVEASLGHRFADVRQEALVVLAGRSGGPLTPELRSLANDKGHRVRETVLRLLKERPHPDNMDAILQLASDTWSAEQRYHEEVADYPIAQGAAVLLWNPPQINDKYISVIGKLFQQTADHDVKLALTRALVRNGSDEARKRVLRYALKTGNPPHHRLAAEALFQERQFVDAALAAEITDDQLLLRTAPVAFPLTLVVGACADTSRVISAAKELAAKQERRALLIPLAIAAAGREGSLAEQIMKLLPTKTADALSQTLEGTGKLSAEDLNGLGDVRTTETVKTGLSVFFENAKDK